MPLGRLKDQSSDEMEFEIAADVEMEEEYKEDIASGGAEEGIYSPIQLPK